MPLKRNLCYELKVSNVWCILFIPFIYTVKSSNSGQAEWRTSRNSRHFRLERQSFKEIA